MSMTREEARKQLEELFEYCENMKVDGEIQTWERDCEAIEMAISALRPITREQVERMRGEWVKPHWRNSTSCAICSQCGFEAHHHEYHGVQDTYLFCPHCMAPMTDEAVQMVMERLEALHSETKTD